MHITIHQLVKNTDTWCKSMLEFCDSVNSVLIGLYLNTYLIYRLFESVYLTDPIVLSVGFLPAGFGPIDSTPVKKPVPRRGQAHGANIPMITELGGLLLRL